MVSNGWLTIAIFMVSFFAPEGFRIGEGNLLELHLVAGEPRKKSRRVKDPNATCLNNRAPLG